MSLINQMLKDLERQRNDYPSPILTDLQGGKFNTQSRSYKRSIYLLFLIAGAMLTYFLIHQQYKLRTKHIEIVASQLPNPTIADSPSRDDHQDKIKTKIATVIKDDDTGHGNQTSADIHFFAQQQQVSKDKSSQTSATQHPITPVFIDTTPKNHASTTTKQVVQVAVLETKPQKKPIQTSNRVEKTQTTIDPEQLASFYFRQARRYLTEGSYSLAKNSLQKSLQYQPSFTDATVLLANIYIKHNQLDDAQKLLEQALGEFPSQSQLAKLAARIAVERGKIVKAIQYLEDSQPDIATDPDYYALLAALYQKNGSPKQARDLYSRLVFRFPENGLWWMALGIAQSSTQAWQEAYDAFSRAHQAGGLDQPSSRYVRSQISMLEKRIQ